MAEIGVTRAWRKASFSGGEGGNCVEVGSTGTHLDAVRDTKNRAGEALSFATGAPVDALIAATRRGQLY
ncbi:MAG TPA: DUF397 domain-containing protein [Actinokineospora sp.]|nr:DUF397 domain-containing protein [Actinokineospora sp.]